MKFIITEEQEENLRLYKIYELAKPYLEEKGYNNLRKVTKSNTVHYVDKDDTVRFRYRQDIKNDNVFIDYPMIWEVFESYFSLEYKEIQELMRHWLDEVYKLKGLTPCIGMGFNLRQLDEVYKLKGLSPLWAHTKQIYELDEAYKLKGNKYL